MKVGIIGYGVVGGAIGQCLKEAGLDVVPYDKYKKIGSYEQVCQTDLIFVSVPTPTVDGLQDLSPLQDVLLNLSMHNYANTVVIKCTVLPGTCDMMQDQYPNLILAHNPEFLTERNAAKDFQNQAFVPLSARKPEATASVIKMFDIALPKAACIVYLDFKTTELGKYIHNTFLATKVSFMNEIYDYCQFKNINYNNALSVATLQGVIGQSHTKVPGPDGSRGYGGMCFPKDTSALINQPGSAEILTVLGAAVNANKRFRPDGQ